MNRGDNQNLLGNPGAKSKPPILFTVFTLLLLIDGVFTILGSFPALLIGGILAGGIFIIIGIGKIIVAIGLRKMKNWALYGFTIIVILMITPFFREQKDLITILTRIYEIIILVYFWYIFKKQVSKIWILAILIALITGGFFAWQYFGTSREVVKTPEEVAKDETADWKTYRNEEYGFEFKYPPDLKQFEWPSTIITVVTPDYKVETSPGPMSGATLKGAKLKLEVLQLGVDPIVKEDFVTRRCEYLKIGSPNLECKQLTFLNSSSAEVIDKVAGEIREKTFFIEKDKKAYILSADVAWPITEHQEFFNTFNQILSTFRFLE